MTETDIIKKIYIIKTDTKQWLKFSIFPSTDLTRKMSTGVVALDEDEVRRLYVALTAFFEKGDLPEYCEIKDLRNMQRKQLENNRFERPRVAPASAESIQRENLLAEGRLPQQTMGDVAEIRKKSEVN